MRRSESAQPPCRPGRKTPSRGAAVEQPGRGMHPSCKTDCVKGRRGATPSTHPLDRPSGVPNPLAESPRQETRPWVSPARTRTPWERCHLPGPDPCGRQRFPSPFDSESRPESRCPGHSAGNKIPQTGCTSQSTSYRGARGALREPRRRDGLQSPGREDPRPELGVNPFQFWGATDPRPPRGEQPSPRPRGGAKQGEGR